MGAAVSPLRSYSAGERSFPGQAPALEKVPTLCLLSPPPQVLAGLLHLGNVQFADSGDEAQPCQLVDDAKCKGGDGVAVPPALVTYPGNQAGPAWKRALVGWVRGQKWRFGIDALD